MYVHYSAVFRFLGLASASVEVNFCLKSLALLYIIRYHVNGLLEVIIMHSAAHALTDVVLIALGDGHAVGKTNHLMCTAVNQGAQSGTGHFHTFITHRGMHFE